MTQAGETSGYTVSDHIKAIYKHTGGDLFDYVVVNREESSRELINRYREEGAFQVKVDKKKIRELDIKVIEGNLLSREGFIRHNPDELAKVILGVMKDRWGGLSFTGDVKHELVRIKSGEIAELAALIRMNGTIQIINKSFALNIKLTMGDLARKVYSVIKKSSG